MKEKKIIVIAGGTGLIGSRLIQYLPPSKYNIRILSRRDHDAHDNVKYFKWDTDNLKLDNSVFNGASVIINLAGAGIADKKWTVKRKEILLTSRVNACKTIAKALAQLEVKPNFYFGASAIGLYGDRKEEILTTESERGNGFLADLTEEWERANVEVTTQVSRSVILRIGIVLSKKGGALKEILKPASAGVYGYFGDGRAYYSWIHIDDICNIIQETIEYEKYHGTYNGTAPTPVNIKELVKAVKKAKGGLGFLVPVPKTALSLTMGEMTNILFFSTRAIPSKLLTDGFDFKFETVQEALNDLLKK